MTGYITISNTIYIFGYAYTGNLVTKLLSVVKEVGLLEEHNVPTKFQFRTSGMIKGWKKYLLLLNNDNNFCLL